MGGIIRKTARGRRSCRDTMITQEGESLSVVSDGSKFEGTFTGNRMVIKGSLYSMEAGYGGPGAGPKRHDPEQDPEGGRWGGWPA